jgi:filamentous hemagglutinin family protein
MYRGAVAAAALAVAAALLPAAVEAQITFDGRAPFTPAPPPTGPNFVISDGAGRQVGNNLFHSFGQFNVGAGESATFTGPNSTANVIGRVTGGASSINGLIDTRTWMPSANFFLLNPAGIMLGSGASLNVGGSFHFTTADYVCLGAPGCLANSGAGKFFANPDKPSVLAVAPPASFGFLGPPTGSIVVQGGGLPLSVDPGQTMSFVGGPVQVTGATLIAPGGRVHLVSVSSAGEVLIPSFAVAGIPGLPTPTLGPITVTASTIDVSGDPSGTVSIRGGQLVIDSSTISAVTGDADGAPVAMDLAAAASLTLTNSSTLLSVAGGAGRGGDIVLTGGSVELTNTSTLLSANGGAGRGGDIRVTGGSVELANGSLILSSRGGDGAGGDIVIAGDSMRLSGASAVISSNGFEGPAQNGRISATATGAMVLTEASTIQSSADAGDGAPVTVTAGSLTMDGGATIQSVAASGRGGDVVVTAPQLTLLSGAAISTTNFGPGRGGDVRVNATAATIAGEFTGLNTGSFFGDESTPPDQGLPGDIVARFGSLFLTDSATIQSGVLFGTKGANVSVVATGPIVISNRAGIASQARFSDAGNVTISAPLISIINGFISTATVGSGRAGDVIISGGSLELANGGQIVTASINPGTGAGGDVHVNLSSALTISGSSGGGSALPPVYSTSFTDPRSGIFSTTETSGPGGNITIIQSPQIQLLNGGTISAASTGEILGSGSAGQINVTAGDSITIIGASPTGQSGFFSTTAGPGAGGNITIQSRQIQLLDGGTISAASTSVLPESGPAGQINATAGESITISGVSPTGQSGFFSTTAGTGAGGSITLRAPRIRLADGGTISASSTGGPSATAGSIDINFDDRFSLNGATITTDSSQADGGNITITSTGSIFDLINSQITTSVRSGVGGGGNITLGTVGHPIGFVVLSNSGIHADAFGGPGGNVNIFANVLLSSTPILTAITASSTLSTSGTISINAVATDVTSSLPELRTDTREAAALLRASCAARLAEGKTSSLVVAGREGVPLEPGGLMPSALMEPRRVAELGSVASFLTSEWPGLRLAYLDAACGR